MQVPLQAETIDTTVCRQPQFPHQRKHPHQMPRLPIATATASQGRRNKSIRSPSCPFKRLGQINIQMVRIQFIDLGLPINQNQSDLLTGRHQTLPHLRPHASLGCVDRPRMGNIMDAGPGYCSQAIPRFIQTTSYQAKPESYLSEVLPNLSI